MGLLGDLHKEDLAQRLCGWSPPSDSILKGISSSHQEADVTLADP